MGVQSKGRHGPDMALTTPEPPRVSSRRSKRPPEPSLNERKKPSPKR